MVANTPTATFPPGWMAQHHKVASGPHYAWLIAHVAVFALAIIGAGMLDFAGWRMAMAAICGTMLVQIGMFGHDVEHGQVSRTPKIKRMLSLFCWNLLLGLSAGWWREKHRAHHEATHVPGADPDLFSLYAFNREQADRATGIHRLFIVRQHQLFWVSLVFARLYFQWLSLVFLLSRPRPGRRLELGLLTAHHAGLWWIALAALPHHASGFIAVSYLVTGGYMGLVFCTNHLGMPHPSSAQNGKLWQIAHTRNIRTGRIGDYLFGGLNYQIEHHLFPSLSRFRLHAMAEPTRQFCRDSGLPYHEQELGPALRDIYFALRHVASGTTR